MFFFHYVVRKLVRRFGNNALTVVVIGFVLAGCMFGVSFLAGLRAAARESIPSNHVIVTSEGAVSEAVSAFPAETIRQLEVLPGIQTIDQRPAFSSDVVGTVLLPSSLTGSDHDEPFIVRGIDPIGFAVHGIKLASGRLPTEGAPEVAIGAQFAQRYPAVKIGSKITLPTETWDVVGVFTANGSVYEAEAIGSRSRLTPALKAQWVNSVVLVAASESEARELIQAVNESKRFEATAAIEREFRGSQAKLGQVTRVILVLVITLCLIGVFVTATNLHASLIARIPEFAALIALGVRRNRVAAIVLMESVVLSCLGVVFAIGLMLLVHGRSSSLFEASAMFKIEMGVLPIAVGVVLGVLVAVIGACLPAWKVRSLELVQSLR